MIKLTVMYPNLKGSHFDWDYYVNVHIPLAKERFGEYALAWEVNRGIEGERDGEPAPYQVMTHLTLTSLEDFRRVSEEHGAELKGDFPNYTNVYPDFLISEVGFRE